MMKKHLLTGLAVVIGLSVLAQNTQKPPKVDPVTANKVHEVQTTYYTGNEIAAPFNKTNYNSPVITATPPPNETIIGGTSYDVQTNSSISRRLHFPPGGNYATVWTFSDDLGGGWPDRGTGYNYFSSGSQGLMPITLSIENPLRTGWPELGHTTSGKEITICHDPAAYVLIQNDRPATGNGAWTQTTLTVLSPMGVWPRMAIGGSNGQTIHLICDTEPGTPYNGMDPALLYSRSTDGGVTWDILPMQLPGMDVSNYLEVGGDAYSIDARGDVVAIVEGTTAHDVALWKSLDNGATWTRTIVQENGLAGPFDEVTTLILQQDSIPSAGGSVHVLIDENDVCHVFFDRIYIFNDVLNDGNFNLFMNAANFLSYWNENMGSQPPMEIGGALDTDGDNILDISVFGIPRYVNTNNLNSMPSAGIDQNGCIYLTYTAITEYADGVNYYRHAFGTYSCDGGCSWSFPTRLTPGSFHGGTHAFDDCTFVTSSKTHGDSTYHWFQMDPEPGQSVGGNPPEDQVGPNDIVFLAMDKTEWDQNLAVCYSALVGDSIMCAGDSTNLTAMCGTAWSWSTGDNTQSIWYTGAVPATVNVSVTTPCGQQVETMNITAPSGPPSFTITATQNQMCPGDSSFITASYVTGGSYLWSTGGTNQTITVFNIGWYVVTVTNCGGTTVDSINISLPPPPTALIIGSTTICLNDSTLLVVSPISGGSYLWSTGQTTDSIYVYTTSTYSVTVTNCSGTDNTNTTVVNEPPPLVNVVPNGALTFCEGDGPLVLTAQGTGVSWLWSEGSMTSAISLNSAGQSGDYWVIAYNVCGDSVISDTTTVLIYPAPTPPIIILSGLTYTCQTAGVSYEWYMNGSPVVPAETNQTYICPWQTCGGQNITCVITDANGCTSVSNVIIGIDDKDATGEAAFEVYPNPNEGQFGLYFTNAENDAYSIEVGNILGQVVFSKELQIAGSYTLNLDLRKLDKGVYFIKVSNSEGGTTKKIVIR